MNNEIGRKITSLTLMTIMIAGGLAAAFPSVMPAAFAANANLFVSAENSQFDNYMSGPQVIEVVVIDADINDTNEAKGEPDVTVNGKILRMTQAVDGNWYGYFADKTMAQRADATSTNTGVGLDFGSFCTAASTTLGISLTDTSGVAINSAAGSQGTAAPVACNAAFVADGSLHVVREAKQINTNDPNPGNGQIGVNAVAGIWPFIQLYSLNPTGNVVIQYNKGGGAQTTTLTFDSVDQFAGAELDRATYTTGAQVMATITDLWLNIDPTDEDSWTFGTTGTGSKAQASVNYQVFDENGNQDGDLVGPDNIINALGGLMCEDNCVLITNADVQNKGAVITLQDNDDSEIRATFGTSNPQLPGDWQTLGGNIAGKVPITVTEQGPNSGVFGSYDESDTSNIVITSGAKRGTSASIDYNESPKTILVGFSFGSVNIQPTDSEWSSGEEIPVTIVDADANKNSRADEDLDFNDPNVTIIPSLRTGSPATLEGLTNAGIAWTGAGALTVDTVQAFSDRAILRSSGLTATGGDVLTFTVGPSSEFTNAAPLNDASFRGVALLNYDLRSLVNDGNLSVASVSVTVNGQAVGSGADGLQDLLVISDATQQASTFPTAGSLTVAFTLNGASGTIPANTLLPTAVDVFGFGFVDDGVASQERVANQIIRIEAEETGDNTSTFEGSLEYTMINQLNILDLGTYTGLSTIANDPSFIVMEDLTDEDSPRVNYLDVGADGVATQVSDQEEAPSHSGIVSFDNDSYKVADTVLVTLEDKDLNVDSDLIDIYTVVDGSLFTEAARDAVGEAGLPVYGFGPLGRLMDVTFDDLPWQESETCTVTNGADSGLGSSTFSLIETGVESGIFTGDFQVPSNWCRPGALAPETVTGLDMEVNYVDYRDASGEIIEVGDAAGIRANTGSVSLDRTVYPVPFGVPSDFGTLTGATSPDNRSIFPIHATGFRTIGGSNSAHDLTVDGSFLSRGDLTVHVRVNDPDFDISASGEDKINLNTAALPIGPVKISVIRGSSTVILGYAGGPTVVPGTINVGTQLKGDGMIAANEILLNGITGFTPGAISITEAGSDNLATATFTDLNAGQMDSMELAINNNISGFVSQDVTIDQTAPAGPTGIAAVWTDLNGDTNVDTGEVKVSGNTVFTSPSTITIKATIPTPGVTMATATFTDVVKIDDGELTMTNPGTGYTTGKVNLVQGPTTKATQFTDTPTVRQFGPITEIAPDAGIFEADIPIRYTDGPSSTICPETLVFTPTDGTTGTSELNRFSTASASDRNYCILQGDILQVEYTDPADASGDVNTVTDSATFDLRNGVLQSDKSVYIIGSDMILTLIEPDFDLDNDSAETYDLDLIEWDSDAATVTMGDAGGSAAAFDPEPTDFRETGDSTGIFQIVIEIPSELEGDNLERGEEIVLEYTDWGPSGSDFVGDEDQDVNLTIYTSNFGATVELDQKVYTWTDKVYITIVAPDHNFDSNLVDEIGNTDLDPIKVSTRGDDIDNYKLVETGTDTGIFTGEVILTGFTHDADGDTRTGDANGNDVVSRAPSGHGPTDGLLPADDDDGITVSFEFSEDETVVGSALIRWNIGETQWLEASYPASGTGVVRVIDPDMNLDPESVDNFDIDVWSDSDAGGIDLTVTETNEATGIFEGTVFFTITDESSGHRLRVAEGDTVTAEYADNTLPDPYTTADELDISATTLIGTVVPPLERAPATNCRVVDAFGNTLSSVSVDQQVQITCDVSNGQDREQPFAYLIQIQDANGVTVSLAWITGSLSPGQSFSPALSWIPEETGTFDVTAFVWESVDNPTALSPPQDTSITVN